MPLVPIGSHYGTDLLAGILGIEIVKNIADHGKIVIPFGAVYGVVHRNKAHVIAGEHDLRIAPDLQIISPETAHVCLCQVEPKKLSPISRVPMLTIRLMSIGTLSTVDCLNYIPDSEV